MCKILVGMSTCGMSAGAKDTYKKLETLLAGSTDDQLTITGCIGMCFREPLVEIRQEVVNLTIASTSKILRQDVDDDAHRRLVDDFLGSKN